MTPTPARRSARTAIDLVPNEGTPRTTSRVGRVLMIAASTAALVSLAACSPGSDADPTGIPTTTSSSSATVTPTPTATPSEPAWRDEYTDKQLAAYDEALDRWATFEQRAAPIWARGAASPAAEQLFREFLPSPLWQDLFATLSTYEEVDIKVPNPPEVLWSKATRIKMISGQASVTIEECVDLTAQKTTQYGEPVEFPKEFRKPIERKIVMGKTSSSLPWLIYEYPIASTKDFERCDESEG